MTSLARENLVREEQANSALPESPQRGAEGAEAVQIGPTAAAANGFAESDRYSRQILFRGIGAEGQRKLASARVAIVGCGATGSALAGLLARAGVGTLRIIDRDYVEPSNLQRQSLFDENDAAESLPKAIAAARKITAFNSQICVEPKVDDLVPGNLEALLEGMQLILDGTDNFETRYLINDYAVERSLPWIYSAAVGSYAVTLNVLPGETACLACLFPDSPRGMVETCETSGVLNSAVNLVASIAATEALKLLVGGLRAPQLRRTLLSFDLWTNEQAEISAAKPRHGCRACCERDFIHLAGEGRPHITLCGRNSVQIHERQRPIDFAEMNRRLQPHGTVRHNDFVLKFWRDPYEMTLFPDGRAIIKGTTDTAVARSLYARYVGS
ncbi:MAG TPA: ThiF family adenylyltransferase [Terriglobales bacterium]|nr:ThiF family adenylyltransferase [Terriglobales bacterium]